MTYVVAEIGSNHNGDYFQAADLIGAAKDAGADAAKFQCLPSLPHEWLSNLKSWARAIDIDVFATPFDVEAVEYLAELEMPYLKIASVEIVRRDLIKAAAATGIPLLISTGMATMDEIKDAIITAGAPRRTDITLLQCTTQYPTPPSHVHLRAMVSIGQAFGLPVGLSDHSMSTVIPAAAVALGASVIEKHLTFSRDSDGPDHGFALEPSEFRKMVVGIREVELALGSARKDGPLGGEPIEARGRQLTWTT